MDMLHEEVIREELNCVDKKRLVKNELTGSFERDDEVFESAARWYGFYGAGRKGKSFQNISK